MMGVKSNPIKQLPGGRSAQDFIRVQSRSLSIYNISEMQLEDYEGHFFWLLSSSFQLNDSRLPSVSVAQICQRCYDGLPNAFSSCWGRKTLTELLQSPMICCLQISSPGVTLISSSMRKVSVHVVGLIAVTEFLQPDI